MSNIVNNVKLNFNQKHNAFPYQVEAFNFVKDLDYAAIFHEQGLGKTKIAIDLLLYWLQFRDIDTVLIVTKKQLIKNWSDEIRQHSFLAPRQLGTDRTANFYVLNSATKVVITNFETILTEFERINLFLKARNVALIVDESAKLKNPETKLTKSFFEISGLFKIRLIMTGTPVANRPYDIWSQIFILDHGKALGENFIEFKKEADLSNHYNDDLDARNKFEDNISSIFDKIKSFSIRETKNSTGIELPSKKYENVFCNFSPRQKEMYFKVIQECEVEIKKYEKRILDDDKESLKRLIRLNQITSNPKLIDDSYDEISGKEKELEKLLKTIIDRGEKVIVWSSYIGNINYLCKKFIQYSPVKIHGAMTIEDRNKSVEKFKFSEQVKVLFATPQAAKEGLTLTVANNAIFYDRTFNLDDYLQAQDRIHRISQNKICTIYILKIRNSIDEWIEALLTAKQYAASLTQGDIKLADYKALADYSYGELIKEILTEGLKNGK